LTEPPRVPDHPPSRFKRRDSVDAFTRRDQSLAFVPGDDAAAWTPPGWFGRVVVVLFEPTDAVNIGVVVRAMANTGFARLRLANPLPFDPWHVIGVAHYTQHIVDLAATYPSLPAAVADAHLVIGLTGKHHRAQRNAVPFADALTTIAARCQAGDTVALVLGREDSGLTNAALDSCHMVTTIPTNPAYPSLNLAQATLLTLYGLFERAGGQEQQLRPPRRAAPPASAALIEDMLADLERALDAIGYLKQRSPLATMRLLRAALARAGLDTREAALLRSVFLEVRHYLHRHGLLAELGPVGRGAADQPPTSR